MRGKLKPRFCWIFFSELGNKSNGYAFYRLIIKRKILGDFFEIQSCGCWAGGQLGYVTNVNFVFLRPQEIERLTREVSLLDEDIRKVEKERAQYLVPHSGEKRPFPETKK